VFFLLKKLGKIMNFYSLSGFGLFIITMVSIISLCTFILLKYDEEEETNRMFTYALISMIVLITISPYFNLLEYIVHSLHLESFFDSSTIQNENLKLYQSITMFLNVIGMIMVLSIIIPLFALIGIISILALPFIIIEKVVKFIFQQIQSKKQLTIS
jgi:hypothetical protein